MSEPETAIPDPITDPWRVVSMALLCEARKEPVPEALAEAVEEAAAYLTCSALVGAGMSPEKAISQFDDRDYEIHLTYDRGQDQLGLEIRWADGTTTVTAGSVEG